MQAGHAAWPAALIVIALDLLVVYALRSPSEASDYV
jgi:hypothetical protein